MAVAHEARFPDFGEFSGAEFPPGCAHDVQSGMEIAQFLHAELHHCLVASVAVDNEEGGEVLFHQARGDVADVGDHGFMGEAEAAGEIHVMGGVS